MNDTNIDPAQEFENLIRRYVSLGRRSAKGYEPTVCAVCNDYKERGGFKFEGTGFTHYACFNCGTSIIYDPNEHDRVPRRFKELLTSFGIPLDEVEHIAARAFFAKRGEKASDQPNKPVWTPPKEIEPPPGNLIDINTDVSPWCEVAREYLRIERGLEPDDWPFFVSDDKRLECRIIIPFMHKDRLIYWQARAMDKSLQPRYMNPFVEKDKIIFNYDEIYQRTQEPLFVTEGPIDAISIGPRAISMTGSTLSDWQLGELRKAAKYRKLIFVIDKNGNGLKLGLKVLAEGWFVTVMPDNIDDSNQARKRFGRLWLLNHITSTAVTGFAGKLLLEMKCEKKQHKTK
jgi:hypothetical protein